jgi:hypothetical protein
MLNSWVLIKIDYAKYNYFVSQNFCYILIIPGFGIISTTISAYSNKSVFGYTSSSLIKLILLTQQTICRKVSLFLEILLSTPVIWKFKVSLVKILVIYDNPQITKTRSENFKQGIKEFTRLSMFTLRNNNNFLNSFVNSRPSVLEASVFSGYNPLWPKVNFFKQLRYTHILSNVSSQNNSDLHKNTDKLNPWFVTGFTDGEGCFLINVRPNSKLKIGYSVELVFKIALHLKDKALVENIRSYFGVGTVTVRGSDCIQYWVGSLKDLQVIVHHFDNYPLISQKWSDYELFKQVVDLMIGKEHLTVEGLQKIVSIKAVLNKGLPQNLQAAFPEVVSAIRPIVTSQRILDPHWVSGFVSGEGCFFLVLKKSSKGGSVGFRFLITQHIRDTELLKSLINYLGCGKYYIRPLRPMYGDYLVTKFKDIQDKIIPFFEKYPVKGVKFDDFSDLKQVMSLRENNNTLTEEVLAEIQLIRSGMNKGRVEVPYEDSSAAVHTLLSPSARPLSKVTLSKSKNKRYYSTTPIFNQEGLKDDQIKFNQWLAGLIDGDGEFKTTKKGFSGFKIIMDIKDKSLMYEIKHRYGGSVKEIAGFNVLKYKLQHPKGLISLINDVNGLIRNPVRMLQLNRICEKYNIELEEPEPLIYNCGWFSGLVDSDGSIHIDEKSGQLIISVTQKNRYLLEPLQNLYGGRIKIFSTKEAFQYTIYRKQEVLKLVDGYFKKFPLKSSKASRLNLIKEFYQFQPYSKLDVKKIDKFNQWIQFKNKWDRIVY